MQTNADGTLGVSSEVLIPFYVVNSRIKEINTTYKYPIIGERA